MMGCLARVWGGVFVVGTIASLLVGYPLPTSAALGAAWATLIVVAAGMLIARYWSRVHAVKKGLLALPEVDDDEFVAQLPEEDIELGRWVRQAMAEFLQIPVSKISSQADFAELGLHVYQPHLAFYVIEKVFERQGKKRPAVIQFTDQGIGSFRDFISVVKTTVRQDS